VVTNRTGFTGKFFGCACAGPASAAMTTPIAIAVDRLTRCKSGMAISYAFSIELDAHCFADLLVVRDHGPSKSAKSISSPIRQ
jgi:hypothetical protein